MLKEIEQKYRPWIDMIKQSGKATRGLQEQMLLDIDECLSLIDRMRECLEALVMVQNGPPLIDEKYEWKEAMDKARAIIKETE